MRFSTRPAFSGTSNKAIDAHRADSGRFILTGSQKFTLMRGVSDSLAGRVAVLELDGLSAREVLRVSSHSRPPDAASLIIRGGFPELHAFPSLDTDSYFRSYLLTYLERDVRTLLRIHQLRDFERFLRIAALRSGQLLNKSDLARDVGISPTTSNEWLSVLEASKQIGRQDAQALLQ